MSWSIKAIGPFAAVVHEVQKNPYIPDAIKGGIIEILIEEDTSNYGYNAARVEGHGHSGGGYGSIGKLEVEKFKLAAVPVPEVPVPAPLA